MVTLVCGLGRGLGDGGGRGGEGVAALECFFDEDAYAGGVCCGCGLCVLLLRLVDGEHEEVCALADGFECCLDCFGADADGFGESLCACICECLECSLVCEDVEVVFVGVDECVFGVCGFEVCEALFE